MRDVTLGVQYLHKLNIAHLDIKPANIVFQFNWTGTDRPPVTLSNIIDNFDEVIFILGDLGTAQSFGDDDTTAQTTECVGTPNFCPPEVLTFQLIPRAERVPISVKSCDVYSLGASLARALIPKDNFKQHVTNGTLYNHMIDI